MKAADLILSRLREAGRPLALHEINVPSVAQTAASARLRELRREGLVQSVPVPGFRYTAWQLTPQELRLPL